MELDQTIHVTFQGVVMPCLMGDVLRDVLVKHGLTPHNGKTEWINCKGIGTCGTCAVRIQGPVSEPGIKERVRMQLPPYVSVPDLRLACRVQVMGDVLVQKFNGFWGHLVPVDDEETR